MKKLELTGIIPATVLPMDKNYNIDENSLENYIKWLLRYRIGGLAINVDTGEGPQLYPEERHRVLRIVSSIVKRKIPIIAGLPAGFTEQAVKLAIQAKDSGADAVLVFPLAAFRGIKASEVVYNYYKTIGERADIPLVAFQLQPELGGVIFDEETLTKITQVDQVVALKEASFSAKVFTDTRRILEKAPRKITLLTGNDNFILESFILGADGALIGFGTIATDLQVEMFEKVKDKKYDEAWEIYERIRPLADVIFAPPVRNYRARLKEALVMLGVIEHSYVRPPLLPISDEERKIIRKTLKEAGIL